MVTRHSRWRTQPEEFLQGAQHHHQCVKQQITSSFFSLSLSPSSSSLRPCRFPQISKQNSFPLRINSLADLQFHSLLFIISIGRYLVLWWAHLLSYPLAVPFLLTFNFFSPSLYILPCLVHFFSASIWL